MRYINDIIIHCTANQAGKKLHMEDIRNYHIKVNGWRDIGYHYIIEEDGTVRNGRKIYWAGSHCKQHNAHSIGVAYIGGLNAELQPEDTRTEAQKTALRQLVIKLIRYYHCPVHAHYDYANKACPCFDVHKEFDGLVQKYVYQK